jgi:hypothetical protein
MKQWVLLLQDGACRLRSSETNIESKLYNHMMIIFKVDTVGARVFRNALTA